MSQIGSTEALEKYLQLEKENKRLFQENHEYYVEIQKLRHEWGILAAKINTVYNWLETRKDTKTETVRRKIAETFKFAYMEANFEDMIAKWPCKESRDAALAWLKQSQT